MALDYADMKPRLTVLNAERHAKRREQLQMHQHLGQAMAELLADPKWNVYVEHLQALIDVEKARVESLRDKLTGRIFLSDQEMGQAQVDSAYAKGGWDKLDLAIQLVKDLVARGEHAKDILAQETLP